MNLVSLIEQLTSPKMRKRSGDWTVEPGSSSAALFREGSQHGAVEIQTPKYNILIYLVTLWLREHQSFVMKKPPVKQTK